MSGIVSAKRESVFLENTELLVDRFLSSSFLRGSPFQKALEDLPRGAVP